MDFNPNLITDYLEFQLGQRERAYDGQEYMYVKVGFVIDAAEQSSGQRNIVVIKDDFEALTINNDRCETGDLVGVFHINVPLNYYGWANIYGHGNIAMRANSTAHTRLYTSSNWGRAGTTAAGRDPLLDIYTTEDRGSSHGAAPGVWRYPIVG